MWPWEHAIVGYVAYSLFYHAYYRDSPGGLEAFAIVFASVLPDLIDKPLAWEFEIFEVGYAIGHSIFFAVPLSIAVGALARSRGRFRAGLAFALGYLAHLPADVLDGYLRDGHLSFWVLLWPLEQDQAQLYARETSIGVVDQFLVYFFRYLFQLLSGDLSPYLLFQFGLAGIAGLLWLYDGAPVLRDSLLAVKRLLERSIALATDSRSR
ncbi:metal-dependent hydrolase [Natronococcus jeotgali]|uniref:Membrane-bound metal-dependent hydrolase n=1 Tax=Natronococcus jeotgali DSM 18795 TaxID=1227498 RepID=L9XSF3_9EURY|nr:metal-dependent hydrolase [Natronococcus jeotgali]ELY64346.1 membrane-bound metal-dependent hydrolase [Natronococcus jeotgali DSM 18795]